MPIQRLPGSADDFKHEREKIGIERAKTFWEWAIASKVKDDVSAFAEHANPYGDYRAEWSTAAERKRCAKVRPTQPCTHLVDDRMMYCTDCFAAAIRDNK